MVPFVAMHAGTCFFAAAEEAAEGVSSTNDQHSVQHVATQARLGSALQSDEQLFVWHEAVGGRDAPSPGDIPIAALLAYYTQLYEKAPYVRRPCDLAES